MRPFSWAITAIATLTLLALCSCAPNQPPPPPPPPGGYRNQVDQVSGGGVDGLGELGR